MLHGAFVERNTTFDGSPAASDARRGIAQGAIFSPFSLGAYRFNISSTVPQATHTYAALPHLRSLKKVILQPCFPPPPPPRATLPWSLIAKVYASPLPLPPSSQGGFSPPFLLPVPPTNLESRAACNESKVALCSCVAPRCITGCSRENI